MKEIKRREIYLADLSPIVGSEQDGIRPVLILQNDIGNKHSPTTIVAPITSKIEKTVFPTHVKVQAKELEKDSIVLLEQIRTVDKARLSDFIGRIDLHTMRKVDKAIVVSLDIKYLERIIHERK